MLPVMPDTAPALTLSLHRTIADLRQPTGMPAPATTTPSSAMPSSPPLEDSGSATDRTGWLPQHAALRDAAGELRGLRALLCQDP